MAHSNPIAAGLGAGFIGALSLGTAAYLGFDALFTLIPLGNATERTVMAMLVALLSGCAGLFVGFWWAARRSGPNFAGLRIALLFMAVVFGVPAVLVTINYARTNERQPQSQAADAAEAGFGAITAAVRPLRPSNRSVPAPAAARGT